MYTKLLFLLYFYSILLLFTLLPEVYLAGNKKPPPQIGEDVTELYVLINKFRHHIGFKTPLKVNKRLPLYKFKEKNFCTVTIEGAEDDIGEIYKTALDEILRNALADFVKCRGGLCYTTEAYMRNKVGLNVGILQSDAVSINCKSKIDRGASLVIVIECQTDKLVKVEEPLFKISDIRNDHLNKYLQGLESKKDKKEYLRHLEAFFHAWQNNGVASSSAPSQHHKEKPPSVPAPDLEYEWVCGQDGTLSDQMIESVEKNEMLTSEVLDCYITLLTSGKSAVKLVSTSEYLGFAETSAFDLRWEKEGVEKILVPVQMNTNHWVLVAIDVNKRMVLMLDSMSGKDSISEAAQEIFATTKRLAEYITDIKEWKTLKVEVPQQTNGIDCGVFLLFLARKIVEKASMKSFTQVDIPEFRKKIAQELKNFCGRQ